MMDKKNEDISNAYDKHNIDNASNTIESSKGKEGNDINIFDDFNQDEGLLNELDQIKNNKDIYFYLETIGNYFKIILILLLILFSIIYGYIYIQKSIYEEGTQDKQLLGPFCFILLNGVKNDLDFCTSISTLKKEYGERLKEVEKKQLNYLLSIIEKIYTIENFTKTKDVIFLRDKTEDKFQIMTILEKFDNLKNEFDKIDKQRIQCKGLEIHKDKKILMMNCVAYSAGYESGIRGFNGKNEKSSLLKGTSLSVANSFLNYIEVQSKYFTIINRQKLFKSTRIAGLKTGFTSKTSFNLKLQYNLNEYE